MDDFAEMFNHKAGKNDVVEDAPATFENEVEEPEVNEEPESIESQVEVGDILPENNSDDKQTSKADENTPTYWKDRFEASEKQRRDLQSYTDKRFAELEKKFGQFNQKTQEPKVVEKELNRDEFNDLFLDDPFSALEKYSQTKLNKLNQAPDPQSINTLVMEGVQRSLHDDYDEVISQLTEAAAFNPSLIQEVQSASNPAKKAYELGKNLQKSLQIQKDPAAYEAELRAKWEAELKQTNTNSKRSLRNIPSTSPTKASTPSVSKDPNDLSYIFGGKRK